jgi:Surfeit locus protein 5 subunit 22 of Mediator complex
MSLSERAKDFKRENDRLALRITESYGSLLSLSKISTSEQLMSREAFQMDVAVQSLVTSGEGILRLIHELKLAILLQDVQAMDAEVCTFKRLQPKLIFHRIASWQSLCVCPEVSSCTL